MKDNKFKMFFTAIDLLKEVGLHPEELYCNEELANEMISCRSAMDANGCNKNILKMDTTWAGFCNADEYASPKLKKKYPGLIGQIFGIKIICKEE